MLALLPTVAGWPLPGTGPGHHVCATVGLPARYAPTPGTVIARLCEPPEAVKSYVLQPVLLLWT